MDSTALVDLRREPQTHVSVGYDVGLDFTQPASYTPAWTAMKDEVLKDFSGESIALIDNTTAVNSILMMHTGLPRGTVWDAAWGALLPDLTTLVFGLTHFDRLLVIAHGDSSSHENKKLKELTDWCDQAIVPIRISSSHNAHDMATDLVDKFNRIQFAFFDREDLHSKWSRMWTAMIGNEVAEPFPFTIEPENVTNKKYLRLQGDLMRTLFRTPKHPLQGDYEFGVPYLIQLPGHPESYGGHADLTPPEHRAVYASYHTYRTMFYTALADFFGWPYLPCSVRQVLTHVLPIYGELRPDLMKNVEQLRLVDKYAVKKELRFALPAVSISPSLAAFFKEALQAKGEARHVSDKHWRQAIKSIRAGSERYRRLVARLSASFGSGDLEYIDKIFTELDKRPPSLLESAASVLTAGISVGVGEYTGAAKEAWTLLAKKPWEVISRLSTRWHLSFILGARGIASHCLSLEAQCEALWGHRFNTVERAYLENLSRLDTQLPWNDPAFLE
jgi:hypothetical protein